MLLKLFQVKMFACEWNPFLAKGVLHFMNFDWALQNIF